MTREKFGVLILAAWCIFILGAALLMPPSPIKTVLFYDVWVVFAAGLSIYFFLVLLWRWRQGAIIFSRNNRLVISLILLMFGPLLPRVYILAYYGYAYTSGEGMAHALLMGYPITYLTNIGIAIYLCGAAVALHVIADGRPGHIIGAIVSHLIAAAALAAGGIWFIGQF